MGPNKVRAGRLGTQRPLDGILADTRAAVVVGAVRVARHSPLQPETEAGRSAGPTQKDRVARRNLPAAGDSRLRRKERIASHQGSESHARCIRASPHEREVERMRVRRPSQGRVHTRKIGR